MIDAGPSLRAAEGVSGIQLLTYLVARGWTARPSRVAGFTILSRFLPGVEETIQVLLPEAGCFSDEQRRVADALRTIEGVEQRSLEEIVRDVSALGNRGPAEQNVRRFPVPERDDSDREIFVVDEDLAVRDALSAVLTLENYQVTSFAEGGTFLAAARMRTPACIILDVHLPGRSGLDILKDLNAEDYPAPILMMFGQGDIRMAVDAMKNGALDFIEKPFDSDTVVARVIEATEHRKRTAGFSDGTAANFSGRELLTPREREVLAQIAAGASNKEAGRLLGLSPQTIEFHRARIMEKIGAKNAADLARIVALMTR
jgi:FixJ family two-component response regulator